MVVWMEGGWCGWVDGVDGGRGWTKGGVGGGGGGWREVGWRVGWEGGEGGRLLDKAFGSLRSGAWEIARFDSVRCRFRKRKI